MKSVALIIPAAGSGERLNHDVPKPYIKIAGKTILEHTVSRFITVSALRQIVIATSAQYLYKARDILGKVVPSNIIVTCVEGGSERQHSIYNALQKLLDRVELVAVHDAVRPFIEKDSIEQCIKAAAEIGGAVVGIPAKDTIKKVDAKYLVKETPDRKLLWQAQTPQIFSKEILLEAYNKALNEKFLGTDDSSLVERLNYKVKMIEGGQHNFKITYPVDLQIAKLLLGD